MKITKIKSIFIAAILATGTLASAMSTAHAGGNFGVYFGSGNSGIYVGNGGYQTQGYRGYNNHNYGGNYSRSYQPRRQSCNPKRAIRIAHRYGLNQPHVKRVNRKNIVVRGYNYGHPAKIVFQRTRHGCKVINTRGI